MNKNRRMLILSLAVVAAGALSAVYLVASRPQPVTRPPEPVVPLVRAVTVEPQSRTLTVSSQGTVLPSTESTLVAEVAGRIVATGQRFAEGAAFRRGDLLAQIDPQSYELAVRQRRSQVAQAEVRVAREEAEAAIALEEWRDLEEGEAPPLVRREPQLAEARAALEAAQAALAAAELDLSRTTVRAPFHGRVRDKLADLGQFVGPGTPIVRAYATDYAEIRLPVSLEDLAFLDVDLGGLGADPLPVDLSAQVAGGRPTWPARVVRTAGEVDPATRMLELIARVDRPYEQPGRPPLAVGLFVEAKIEGRRVDGVVDLPRTALRGGDRVLVVDDESRLRFRDVTVLRREGNRTLIAAGLTPGEKVCTSPLETPIDGMRVRLAEGGQAVADEASEEGSEGSPDPDSARADGEVAS